LAAYYVLEEKPSGIWVENVASDVGGAVLSLGVVLVAATVWTVVSNRKILWFAAIVWVLSDSNFLGNLPFSAGWTKFLLWMLGVRLAALWVLAVRTLVKAQSLRDENSQHF
jgi:hypothetical protein